MANIAKLFNESNPINAKTLRPVTPEACGDAHIIKTGRLFGVAHENDEFLTIEASDLEKTGQKLIAVSAANPGDKTAFKSSAPSTGTPFVNIQKLCKKWFGEDQENWKKTLKLIDIVDDVRYYEIVED